MNVEEFASFAYERHSIYVRRKLGMERPWTNDLVLRHSFFCNVFRKVDKTTVWIMDNVARPLANDPYLWAAIVMARYVSRIEALEDMKADGAFDPSADWGQRRRAGANAMLKRRSEGKAINTGAFITTPMLGEWGPTKAHYIANLLRALDSDDFSEALEDDDATMQSIHTILRKYQGIGSFMAYQYVCDFSYITRYLKGAEDAFSWSAPGPGSIRGMRRILHGSPSPSPDDGNWLDNVRVLYEEWTQYVARTRSDWTGKMLFEFPQEHKIVARESRRWTELRIQDVQHWLCEYDKWKRGGSSKRRFEGGAA